tara:strand:+ start:362 stop:496 length:135 start_codon:yes stop_codon:yes gene_type:complete
MNKKKLRKLKLRKLFKLGLMPKKGIVQRLKTYEDDEDYVQNTTG